MRALAGLSSTWSHSKTSAHSTARGLSCESNREGGQVTAVSQTTLGRRLGAQALAPDCGCSAQVPVLAG